LSEVARLEAGVEEAVVGADALKLDVSFCFEAQRFRPGSHLEDSFFLLVDELLLSGVLPHFEAVNERELLHNLDIC